MKTQATATVLTLCINLVICSFFLLEPSLGQAQEPCFKKGDANRIFKTPSTENLDTQAPASCRLFARQVSNSGQKSASVTIMTFNNKGVAVQWIDSQLTSDWEKVSHHKGEPVYAMIRESAAGRVFKGEGMGSFMLYRERFAIKCEIDIVNPEPMEVPLLWITTNNKSKKLIDQTFKKSGSRTTAPPLNPPRPPVRQPPVKPQSPSTGSRQGWITINMSDYPAGSLAPNVWAEHGILIKEGKAQIFPKSSAMVFPGSGKAVMIANPYQTFSVFSLEFNPPIKSFKLTRIGVTGGSSLPQWAIEALSGAAVIVAESGEWFFSQPKDPKSFTLSGKGIYRVNLISENVYGSGTYATFNSVPIVSIEILR